MSWMKNLDDNLRIGSIKAIPKTHNSCAIKPKSKKMTVPWLWAKCQKYDITQQLNMGVRAFDLRLNPIMENQKNKNDILISHTIISNYTLNRVLQEMNTFLEESPDEFIFLFLNSEWEKRFNWDESSLNVLWNIINKYSIIETDINLDTPIKVVRGRIIPIPESYILTDKCNGRLNETYVKTNNSWSLTSLSNVKESIYNFLTANLNVKKLLEIQLNYLPYRGIIPPMFVSYMTNKWFLDNVFNLFTTNNNIGFIGVDFINQNVTEAIYTLNY